MNNGYAQKGQRQRIDAHGDGLAELRETVLDELVLMLMNERPVDGEDFTHPAQRYTTTIMEAVDAHCRPIIEYRDALLGVLDAIADECEGEPAGKLARSVLRVDAKL